MSSSISSVLTTTITIIMSEFLDAGVAIFCFSLSAYLYKKSRSTSLDTTNTVRPQAYILENQVTHARLLPPESAHAFTYPTLSLLMSIDALESRSLDIGKGWIFGYGGVLGRLVGLRSESYLGHERDTRTIREKLTALLTARGFLAQDVFLEDAWIMTMPSFMGFEGINPLTVYFCYKSGIFWLAVLEVRKYALILLILTSTLLTRFTIHLGRHMSTYLK